MTEIFDQHQRVPSNYFLQDVYYVSGLGAKKQIRDMTPFHARNAIKRYRMLFPNYVRHINRSALGKALRRRYLSAYVYFR